MMFSIKLQMLIHFCNKKARADNKETKSQVLRLKRHCGGVCGGTQFICDKDLEPMLQMLTSHRGY